MTEEENFCKKMAKATRGRHAVSDALVNAKLAFGKELEDDSRQLGTPRMIAVDSPTRLNARAHTHILGVHAYTKC